jgi:serine/threonine-protein kinase RsbW
MAEPDSENTRRILGRVTRAEFVGRADELARLLAHPAEKKRGLLLLLAPAAGVSELLRQAYDTLFTRHEQTVPIYFALPRTQSTLVSISIEFLNTFLGQYLAFRRDEPALAHAPLIMSDVLRLAPAADHDWIETLLKTYEAVRFSDNDEDLVRLCLGAPDRIPTSNGTPYVLLDAVAPTAGCGTGPQSCQAEFLRALERARHPFAFAGLRRQVLDAAHLAGSSLESLEILRLERLEDDDARQLVDFAAARQQIPLNDETRDLMVQQFDSSPFFIGLMLQAARERNVSLTSYLACEQLYVDELLGGHFHRHFMTLLEDIAPSAEVRVKLLRLLHEGVETSKQKASFEAWRKVLNVETKELEEMLTQLHVQELVTWDGGPVQAGGGPICWHDFLKTRFRLDEQNEPRALVVADATADALKRAPHTMANHYRRMARLKLRELLAQFNFQLVPRVLFHYDSFKESYGGATPVEAMTGLDAETDLIRLPQVFHAAACTAYNRQIVQLTDEESCAVGQAFEGAIYTEANQLVWLAAQIDSKLEVEKELAELWYERMQALASSCNFNRVQILLVATEGFTTQASAFLEQRSALGVSRQQMDLLSQRLGGTDTSKPASESNEFVAILPMGSDNELLAADMVERIARRFDFKPEAINQIKTAVVEACINAAEHSLSPDRKIYQRFRIESDKLVVIISSRGVVPGKRTIEPGPKPPHLEPSEGRRGWGLKLIRSLMDEVEFERVDDGTSLRMTKYLR